MLESAETEKSPHNAHTTQEPLPFTVSELTTAIKLNLEMAFPRVYLQGEVSNFKQQTSGHLYFSLKDAGAQISAVMFRAAASQLKPLPKGGDQVVVRGELNVYPPKGNYQLIVHELTFVGIGELLQRLEQLKIKLHQMGWFKSSRKKPLPKFPRTIGVVTSPTGAVIQDIINVLSRRFPNFHLILNPVKVQGEGAAKEIAQAIDQFNEHPLIDVMIIGRGGGSLEDLFAFNEEIVAEAIFRSRIPIVCAVGHETDHCIADYVADVRAPTPSAAAEIVIAERQHHLDALEMAKKRMQNSLFHRVSQERSRLAALSKHPFLSQPFALLRQRQQQVDDTLTELDRSMRLLLLEKRRALMARGEQAKALRPSNQILHLRSQLQNFSKSFARVIQEKFEKRRERLGRLKELLAAIDPRNVLQKGYCIMLAEETGALIDSVKKVEPGKRANVRFADGSAKVTMQ